MPPNEPPFEKGRRGTLLETEEDILQALSAQPSGSAVPKALPRTGVNPYRPTARPPVALLTVLDDGKSDGEVLRLRTERLVIGRSEGDFLIPHDPLISARHLEITRQRIGDHYRWVLADLQTLNGLFVRCSRIALSHRSEFLVGRGRYLFDAPDITSMLTVEYVPDKPARSSARTRSSDPAEVQPAILELQGEQVVDRVPLAKSEHWIGSHPSCSIRRVDDPFVEPQHVRLRRAAGNWQAHNNKTANGLWYRVPQITITDTCLFQIGEQRFRLKVGG